jgi:hypothetical protein
MWRELGQVKLKVNINFNFLRLARRIVRESCGAPYGSREPISSTTAWSVLYVEGTLDFVTATRARSAGVSLSNRSSTRCA